ncbi:hypothetical protein [Pseudomonas sp. microsymbiont 2]
MDIDALNQCLQYIELTRPMGEFDKFIPVGSALFGTLIGVSATFFIANWKEKRVENNKFDCCNEDLIKVQESVGMYLKQLLIMMEALAKRQSIYRHRMPHSISPLFLESYFTDVAHKYSKEQRSWIQELMVDLESVNEKTPLIITPEATGSSYDYSRLLLNAGAAAVSVWELCQSVADKERLKIDTSTILRRIGCTEGQIHHRDMLVGNASNGNTTLEL